MAVYGRTFAKLSKIVVDSDPHGLNDLSPGFYPEDVGKKWEDLGVITVGTIYTITYCGNGIVLFGDVDGADGHVFRSTDYGATWSNLGVIAAGIYAMTYCGNGIALLGDDDGHVYRSTDYGATWSDLEAIASGILVMIYCGNGIVLLGDEDGHVFRSTDYGATWSNLGVITFDDAVIYSMTYCGNGIVLLGDEKGHVFRSTDYGVTWSDLGGIAHNEMQVLTYCGNGIALMGDNGGCIYRSDCAFKTNEATSITRLSEITVDSDPHGLNDLSPGLYPEDVGKTWQDLGVLGGR